MDLHFLGAAGTVTGSQFLLETDRAKVLVDCGMFQGSPEEGMRNRVPLSYDPRAIDAILLTHAHLDHCGLLPYVVAAGYRGPIIATDGTAELAELVLLDSGKLQEEFARREARRGRRDPVRARRDEGEERARFREVVELAAEGEAISPEPEEPGGFGGIPELRLDLDEPLYTEAEARRAIGRFRPVSYEQEIEVAPGIHATFLDAGHILGSAIIRVRARDRLDDPASERTIVFSGDIGRPNTPIIRDPTPVSSADYLLVESTYGGREHEPQAEAIATLTQIVRLVAEERGVLLVPSFAIGRTQELVWALDRLIDEGRIPLLPLYLDSPMASKATAIYRRHAEYFDEETARLLEDGATPLDYPQQTITADVRDSEAIRRARRPYMIIASNGMLTGGRVLGHLRDLIDDPAAVLLFVGYQGVGTLGARLQAGAKSVRIEGRELPVRCRIRSISGFSAHADEPELLAWIGRFAAAGGPSGAGEATAGRTSAGGPPAGGGRPRRVFIVHGDPAAQEALEPKIRALGLETYIPHWHERVTLD
jgi:metallo-beta-lactamase family protein